ncbi:hypothetical protein R3W88_030033 [Solanum pinnatisectum]|uniref:Reverse transcriptase zinc-binding domain-containing protein n=1 Tax=Solanum pinnatisectum TaxID=50273 RepID=A0AAV9K882_9SOLN|nr:hypothetical protein R3W88_030033 [Solanum pinnatisectum]
MSQHLVFSWIWKLHFPNKIKYFLWLCNHGRLKTGNYLYNIGMDIDPLCKICRQPETNSHIFLDCP